MKVVTGERTVDGSARPSLLVRLRTISMPDELLLVVAVGLVILGQLAEDLADSEPLQMLPPTLLARRWTAVDAVFYMLVTSILVDRTVRESIPALERVLRIDAAEFQRFVERMRPPSQLVNAALIGASALIVTVLFVGIGLSLPIDDPVTRDARYLPEDPLAALAILAGYTVVGWALLRLIYLTTSVGRALGELCRLPLEIDVFDTTDLLPFGNIALASALAPAGLIVILLVGLGQPTTWLGWTILLLAGSASVLALLLPLRGIHRQMARAKAAALANLNARLTRVYNQVVGAGQDANQPPGLDVRANTLIPLRRTAHEMTTWPFADTVAFGRAVLIASAPLIYTVLNELIKVFWIEPLSR